MYKLKTNSDWMGRLTIHQPSINGQSSIHHPTTELDPGRLTWNLKMEVWKINVLFFIFHVNVPGGIEISQTFLRTCFFFHMAMHYMNKAELREWKARVLNSRMEHGIDIWRRRTRDEQH